MTPTSKLLLLLAASAACPLAAQSIPGAVLAKNEPHHHVAFADAELRVLRVHVAPHDTTLLHEHAPDYFWIALGPSEVVNARPGLPDATISSADMTVHYTPGHFAHVARNPGASDFDNITVEVLRPQANVRNLCEPALAAKPLNCPRPNGSSAEFTGASSHPAFMSDQLRVSLMTIEPGAMLRSRTKTNTWLIALDTLDTRALPGRKASLQIAGGGAWTGGVFSAQAGNLAVSNTSSHALRLLAVQRP